MSKKEIVYKFAIVAVPLIFFMFTAIPAFAAMKFELDYPILGDDVVPVDKFIEFAFKFALGTAGAVALGVLIFGGIKYITSAGNPSAQGDAKKWIQDAILGLLLLLGSYLILNTINPDLVNIGEPAPGSITPGLPQVSEAQYLNCLNTPSLAPMTCGCVGPQTKYLSQGDPCIKPKPFDFRIVPEMIPVCNNPSDTCVTRPLTANQVEVFCCNALSGL